MQGEALTEARVAQAARMYKTNREAAEALNASLTGFRRACQRYGIATPASKAKSAYRRDGKTRTVYKPGEY